MVRLFRFWLPVGLCVAGVVISIALGADRAALEVGTPIFSAGLVVAAVNYLFRLSFQDGLDRDREEDQRAYFAEHGEWPPDPDAERPAR